MEMSRGLAYSRGWEFKPESLGDFVTGDKGPICVDNSPSLPQVREDLLREYSTGVQPVTETSGD